MPFVHLERALWELRDRDGQHILFDLGVLGLLPDLRIQVSQLYVGRGRAGQAIDSLHGQSVAMPPARSARH